MTSRISIRKGRAGDGETSQSSDKSVLVTWCYFKCRCGVSIATC